MKKLLAAILVSAMVVFMGGCAKDDTGSANTIDASNAVSATVTTATVDVDPAIAQALVSESFIDPVTEWSEYDELIACIKSETDYAQRAQLMHKAEDILMSNYCIMPLYYYNDMYMKKDYVSGDYANVSGTKYFMYASLSNGSDTIRINLASEPSQLDPALNSTSDGACLTVNAFSGLYTYDEEGKTVPACAEGYTVSDDGLSYTVTLKSDLKWSDGSALTADDFVYSWKRVVDPATAATNAYFFAGFEGYAEGDLQVWASDDTTLEFKLTAPCAYIEGLLAFPAFFPVCQSYVEANSTEASPGAWCTQAGFVCNGPYVCTGWNHDVSMIYEKNPYWYDADKVTIEKQEYMLSDDSTAAYAAYSAGDLDFIDSLPTDEVAALISSSNPEFHVIDNLGTYYVGFNCKSDLFDGKTPEQAACMREAFSLLADRDYISDNIGQTGQVPANSFIPLGMADGNGGVFKSNTTSEGYYDPYAINNDPAGTINRARELLKAAGYVFGDDGKLTEETPIIIEYLTNQGSAHVAVAESLQQDFATLGIQMNIQVQDWNVFLEERRKGNYDIAREGWNADFNDPINMLEMWTSTSGNNDCQFGK